MQVDLAEGIALSQAAEDRELQVPRHATKTTSVSPDIANDQTIAGETSQGIITRLSYLSIERLQRALRAVPDDPKTGSALADAYQTLAVASGRQGKIEEAEKSFKIFRNFYDSPFAKCVKSGVSYKDDILGILISAEYHSDK